VWLNEKPLCEHEGGFTPFNCEVTAALQDGQNVVIVSVNDARHADDIPSLRPDWYNYGGLTRDIRLVEVPRQFIEQYSIQLDHENARRIAGWIRLAGASTPQKLSVKIPEFKLSTVATTDNEGLARFTLDARGCNYGRLKSQNSIAWRYRLKTIRSLTTSAFARSKHAGRIFCSTESRYFCGESTCTKRRSIDRVAPMAKTTRARCWVGRRNSAATLY